ncbi:hypothetical protein HPB48_010567 [Haemaphysalis longicornis]|uniref:Uncharacterized protein n=1 Tax=Haemaphysalis longicornis TaxID=44386 RepID=A0A9J6H516_HAELO|nr:hypothetical protein HPB48_010567 [Haemaphysalis longicornis]
MPMNSFRVKELEEDLAWGDKGAGQDRPCPELTCPPECEKETVKPAHRCPWCLCPAITAKLTLLNYGERHCPHALLDMVFRQADPLAQHVHHLQEQVRHQDGAVQHLVIASGGGAGERPPPADCVPPKCDGKGCQLVPGDQGCPRCVCTPDSKESKETTRGSRTRRDDQKTTGRRDSRKQDKQTNQTAAAAANRTEAAHPRQLPQPTPKKKGNKTKTGKAVTKRNTGAKKESSEESDESEDHGPQGFAQAGQANQPNGSRRRKPHRGRPSQTASARRCLYAAFDFERPPVRHAAPPPVQCVTPVCEPYCKYRQAEHGCLVCECPDVCPEMVCGAGCQPYFTEASKCQKCLCAPHSRREELAEVFAGFCKEHTLHRMVADFDDFRDILLRLQHRSLELQELIGRAEHARGIHDFIHEYCKAGVVLIRDISELVLNSTRSGPVSASPFSAALARRPQVRAAFVGREWPASLRDGRPCLQNWRPGDAELNAIIMTSLPGYQQGLPSERPCSAFPPMPPFNSKDPELCFALMESHFYIRDFFSQATRHNITCQALPSEVFTQPRAAPLGPNPCSVLKDACSRVLSVAANNRDL